jgi:hypothetical protein
MAFLKGKKKLDRMNPKELWEMFFKEAVKNEWNAAFEVLEKLKNLEPDNSQVYIKCGDILQRKGNKKEAVLSYHKAAEILMVEHNIQKAVAIYKIVLRLDPEDESATANIRQIMGEADSVQVAPAESAPIQAIEAPEVVVELDTIESVEFPEVDNEAVSAETTETPFVEAAEPAPTEAAEPAPTEAAEPAPIEAAEASVTEEVETSLKPQSLAEALLSHPIFSVLAPEDIKTIDDKGTHLSFKTGEAVVTEGDPGDSMFIIMEGQAKVMTNLLGKTYELDKLSRWDFFGEVGFLSGRPRTASVTAEGDLDVLEVSKHILMEITMLSPALLSRLAEMSQSRAKSTISKFKKT